MIFLLLSLLAANPAEARALSCKVVGDGGLYSRGSVLVEEGNSLTVRWRGENGQEETFLGGTKICGQETRAFRYTPECQSTFSKPTPLKKIATICRLPKEAYSKWVGSVLFALDPRDGSASLQCLTSMGQYTDFKLRLNECGEP